MGDLSPGRNSFAMKYRTKKTLQSIAGVIVFFGCEDVAPERTVFAKQRALFSDQTPAASDQLFSISPLSDRIGLDRTRRSGRDSKRLETGRWRLVSGVSKTIPPRPRSLAPIGARTTAGALIGRVTRPRMDRGGSDPADRAADDGWIAAWGGARKSIPRARARP